MKTLGLALVLAVAACGNGQDYDKQSNPVVGDSTPPTATGNDPESDTSTVDFTPPTEGATAQTVALRIRGFEPPGSVLVRVAALEVVADGTALDVQLDGKEIDLGNDQHSWLVTTFDLPSDADHVAINLGFYPDGTVARDGGTQVLDLSGPSLSLVANAAQMRLRGHVVLQLDLAESLIEQDDVLYLLPQFNVLY